MIAWDKHIKVWQLVGAVLAVPAGILGTYGAYKTYVSGNVSCPELRASIISTTSGIAVRESPSNGIPRASPTNVPNNAPPARSETSASTPVPSSPSSTLGSMTHSNEARAN